MPTSVLLRRTSTVALISRATFIRRSSSAPQLVLRQDIPAPHCGSICLFQLNNPKSRNAISRALLAELSRHVEDIANEGKRGQTRAMIIASNVDASFCAGADLKERRQFTPEETHDFLQTLRQTFSNISALPIPTISAISSLALGGGLELALCTNLRVFASTATVALPESRLAIVPGAGGTHRLPALIGRTRALDMMLTGRRVAAAEAYFFGICDRLAEVGVEDTGAASSLSELSKEQEAELLARARNSVLSAAINLAREICEGGPVAIRSLVKAVSHFDAGEGARSGQSRENEAYNEVIGTADRNEALAAFKEKRKPVYKGQ